MPHQLDLGKVAAAYRLTCVSQVAAAWASERWGRVRSRSTRGLRLTFLVDLPEIVVVKQPLRSLLAGIGRPVFCEASRRVAHAVLREPGSPVPVGAPTNHEWV